MISGTVGSDDRCALVAHDTVKHRCCLCRAVGAGCSVNILPTELFHDELSRMRDRNGVARELESRLTLASRQVDQVHVWQRVEEVLTVRASRYCDRCTVHVDLSVADSVVPSPGERCNSVWKVLGNGEGKGMGHAVAVRIDRASAFEYLDEFEDGVNIWFCVHRHSKLAGATTMAGRALEA